MKRFICTTGLLAVGAASVARADPVILQPDEPQSKDVFVYQFLSNMNFDTGGFGALLASGRTSSGHDLRSFLQFDLTGVTLNAGEIATLNLRVGSTAAAGFGVNPSPAAPVVANVHRGTGAWDESAVTWGTQPPFDAAAAASRTISGIDQWVSFDVTPLVQSWLSNPGTNFGLAVTQQDVVSNNGPVVAVYESSAGANKPYLQIAPVPEPGAAGLAFTGASAMLLRRKRATR
jgi:hypothetical protein